MTFKILNVIESSNTITVQYEFKFRKRRRFGYLTLSKDVAIQEINRQLQAMYRKWKKQKEFDVTKI